MSGYIKYCFLCIVLLGCMLSAFSQDRKELEQKKKELNKDIEYRNKLLKETKKNQQLSLSQLVILNKKISKRQELISTIKYEIYLLNKQIQETQDLIASMEKDLQQLKDEYAKMIYYAHKNRSSYDRLMFIFSAKDFNQAYKRLKYMQQYANYRQTQAELIKKTQKALNEKIQELEEKKNEKQQLLGAERQEKEHLTEEKQEKQKVYKDLETKEQQLKREIEKKKEEASKLQKAIQRIIEEEIRRAKAKGKKYFELTPEAKQLSADFASNKGKLPWPTLKGVITGKFGEHPHPVLKGIKIKNNGVDINTHKGATARAVFGGEVSGVIVIPGMGKAVMIRHGEYLTVYSNLKDVFVQRGDKIEVKQDVGLVVTDEAEGKTELHFEVWKETSILNPSDWIYKAK